MVHAAPETNATQTQTQTQRKTPRSRRFAAFYSDRHNDQAVTAALRGDTADTTKVTTIFATNAIRPIYSG